MKVSPRGFFLSIVSTTAILFLFQNCAPAKLNGDTASSGIGLESTGTVVDLPALLKDASNEASSNVLYPSTSVINEYDYAVNVPIIENVVLRNNDFSRIEWVYSASSTVVASGEAFNQKKFSADQLGNYYVFGYRGQVPYLISQFKLIAKTGSTLSVNSVGAVVLNRSTVAADSTNESILITVEAPAVNLSSVQFVLKNTGQIIANRRAILVTKKVTEQIDVEVNLSDISGQTYSQTVSLNAKPEAPPAPIASFSATVIDFGNVSSGGFGGTTKYVTVTNTGNAVLNFGSMSVSDFNFTLSNKGTCGSTLAAGASCTIGVTCEPFGFGNMTGSLRVSTNAQPTSTTIQLKGNSNF